MHSSAWLGPFLVYSNKLLPGGLRCSSCAGHQDVNPKASSNGSTLGKLSVASLVACANLGVGVPLYGVIKPFVKWYMRNLTIDINEDMEIYDINCRNLDQANPKRLAATVRAMARFSIWEYLPKYK